MLSANSFSLEESKAIISIATLLARSISIPPQKREVVRHIRQVIFKEYDMHRQQTFLVSNLEAFISDYKANVAEITGFISARWNTLCNQPFHLFQQYFQKFLFFYGC